MAEDTPLKESSIQTVLSLISAQPGMTLAQLHHYAEGVSADEINCLIAQGQIYVDLGAAPLTEPEKCFVFRDQDTAIAYASIALSQNDAKATSLSTLIVEPGVSVCLDGRVLTITLIGETSIYLQSDANEPIEFKRTTFDSFIQQGKVTGLKTQQAPSLNEEAQALLGKASKKDLEDANRRHQLLKLHFEGRLVDGSVPARTLRYWAKQYRQAEITYGNGYFGLLSSDSKKGNRNRKLPEHLLKLIDKFIAEDYETYKQKNKNSVYAGFVHFCGLQGIPDDQIPSYKTFIREIKKHSGYNQTLKREGRRAAYAQEPFYLELERTTPRHGERPFEIGHIDHTELDIELRCSQTGRNLGRPWVTFLVDVYSRRVLAVHLTFDPPSYRSCLMVLRICIQRYNRLPHKLVTDNGAEFHSVYYQTFLSIVKTIPMYRPASKPRFNSVGERLFGTTMTQVINNMEGNTQATKKVRQMSQSNNPKNLARWTLGLLYHYLCEWTYEVYDQKEHPALGQSPREVFQGGMTQFGSRDHRRILYDDKFRFLILPTTSKGTAKVQPGLGVKINYLYYWSSAFRDPEIENTQIDIRFDPFDAGIAYAYVRGRWVECMTPNPIFRGRSSKELELASKELRERHRSHARNFKLNAKELGAFLSTIEAEEVLLEQRLRDQQNQDVLRVIDGGKPSLEPYSQPKPTADKIKSVDDLNKPASQPLLDSHITSETVTVYGRF